MRSRSVRHNFFPVSTTPFCDNSSFSLCRTYERRNVANSFVFYDGLDYVALVPSLLSPTPNTQLRTRCTA